MKVRTLGHRLTIANSLLILAIVGLGATALSGFFSLGRDIDVAVSEHEEGQMLGAALVGMERALVELRQGTGNIESVAADLRGARAAMQRFADFQTIEYANLSETEEAAEEGKPETDTVFAAGLLKGLDSAIGTLGSAEKEQAGEGGVGAAFEKVAAILQSSRDRLSAMTKDTDLNAVRKKAAQRVRVSALFVGGLSVLIVGVALVVSVRVHRQVAGSVAQLQQAVRKIAQGRLTQRVEERGDLEIVELARDFNKMAVELDTLYRVMEARVQEKTSELVRSERLASVGYLAAGVAHEVSNPLSIMAGYATLARRWLAGRPGEVQLAETREALETIESEAFRCKAIVEQLTALSIAGSDARRPVSLKKLTRELISLVGGLERGRDRKILFENDDGADDVAVLANAAELKQVGLNLIVNALGATESQRGEIRISIERSEGRALLSVSDNGCGIGPETIEKVFEPFFTMRTDTEKQGLGLGLTISHAIVEAHGGRLVARSEGLGKGSSFIVELPELAPMEAAHV